MTVAGNQGQNVYPSPENYPVSSFPQPVPAPDFEANDAGTLMTVQYSWEWQQVLLAAVDQLKNPATWQGDHDQILQAIDRATDLQDLLQIPVNSLVEAPYWDDENGDDAGDDEPPDEQPWYGVWDGETFVESLAYWAVTAFLATGITEGAAISFITPLRKFRLLLKSSPAGAKVLLFMNSNIFQLIDLFSADDGVVSVDVDLDTIPAGGGGFRAEDVDTNTLMIVHSGEHNPLAVPVDGNYLVQPIRKRLYAAELAAPGVPLAFMTRYDPDTLAYQVSTDGGSTWTDSPQADPRNITYVPPPTGDNARCDAAHRVRLVLQQLEEALVAQLGTGAFEADIVAGFLGVLGVFIPGLAIAILVVSVAVTAMAALGQVLIEAAFDETVWGQIECIMFCRLDDPPVVDPEIFAGIQADMTAQLSGTASAVVNYLLGIMGYGGFNNVAGAATDTGDCSGCECFSSPYCVYFDDPDQYVIEEFFHLIPLATVDEDDGFPDPPCIKAGQGDDGGGNNAFAFQVAIPLAEVVTVNQVSFYTDHNFNVPIGTVKRVILRDADDVEIYNEFVFNSSGESSWDATIFTPGVANTKTVVIEGNISSPGLTGSYLLDSVCIEFT